LNHSSVFDSSDRGRVGIGYNTSGDILILIFGVSNETGWQSVTLYEFRDIADSIGCYEAIFLDGGSSSQLKWTDGYEYYGFGGISRTDVPTIVNVINP